MPKRVVEVNSEELRILEEHRQKKNKKKTKNTVKSIIENLVLRKKPKNSLYNAFKKLKEIDEDDIIFNKKEEFWFGGPENQGFVNIYDVCPEWHREYEIFETKYAGKYELAMAASLPCTESINKKLDVIEANIRKCIELRDSIDSSIEDLYPEFTEIANKEFPEPK